MKLGMTRWKMVPSYSGTPCFLAWEMGLVQSLVPSARPMKLATPTGALSGKRVQVSLPAAVSMTAVGPVEVVVAGLVATAAAAAGFLVGAVLAAGDVCDHIVVHPAEINKRVAKIRMEAPGCRSLIGQVGTPSPTQAGMTANKDSTAESEESY